MFQKKILFFLKILSVLLMCGCLPLLSAQPASLEKSHTELYKRVYETRNAGFYPGVVKYAETFLESFPRSVLTPEVQVYTGEALYYLCQPENAAVQLIAGFSGLSEQSRKDCLLKGTAVYWLGRISWDTGNYAAAADYFADAGSYLRRAEADAVDADTRGLYLDALLYGARSCLKAGFPGQSIPVLEYLWSVPLSAENRDLVTQLLFESYTASGNADRCITAFSVLEGSHAAVASAVYDVAALYTAAAYKQQGLYAEAYRLYSRLVVEGGAQFAVQALQAAWNLAEYVAGADRAELLEQASARLQEYPLLLAEFRTRQGIDFFTAGQRTVAAENFRLSQGLLSNISTGADMSDLYEQLSRTNSQYLAEIFFLDNGSTGEAAASAYNLLRNGIPETEIPAEDLETQLLRYAVIAQLPLNGEHWILQRYESFFNRTGTVGTDPSDRAVPSGTATNPGGTGIISGNTAEAAYWYSMIGMRVGDYTGVVDLLQFNVFNGQPSLLPEQLFCAAATLYANALFLSGQQDMALEYFNRFAGDGVLTDAGILNYAKALLLTGDMESALTAASSVTGIEASYLEMLAAAGTGDWNRVEKLAEICQSQKDFAFLSYVRYYSGIARYRLENYAEAYTLLYEFAADMPAHPYTRSALKTAASCALQLYQQQPDSETVWLDNAVQIAGTLVRTAPNSREQENSVMLAAGIFSDAALYDRGIELLEPYCRRQDQFGLQCRLQLADLYVKKHQLENADSYYEQICRLFSDDPAAETAAFRRGEIFYVSGQYESAAQRFNEYRKMYPAGMYADAALYFNGDSLSRLGRTDEAVLQFSLLVTYHTDSTFMYGALSALLQLYRDNGEYATALETARCLMELYPEQAVSDGVPGKTQELTQLAAGTGEAVVAALAGYKKAGGSSTATGRVLGVELAMLYAASPVYAEEGVALVQELLAAVTPVQESERKTAADINRLSAEFNRNAGSFTEAGRQFLKAAELYAAFDTDQAASALYRAAESFDADGKTADARDIAVQMELQYPDSAWTVAAAEFK